MISQPGPPGPPGPPGVPGSPGSMVSISISNLTGRNYIAQVCCLPEALTQHLFQGLHGMPGPKVRLQEHKLYVVCGKGSFNMFGTQYFCVSMQGEPGYGLKGEKGDAGGVGPRVSDSDPCLS